jgi:hypothetical protein
LTITFLTTEDAESINRNLSNLSIAIADLVSKLAAMQNYEQLCKDAEESRDDYRKEKERYEKLRDKLKFKGR